MTEKSDKGEALLLQAFIVVRDTAALIQKSGNPEWIGRAEANAASMEAVLRERYGDAVVDAIIRGTLN